ncbi:MAG: 4Fe-4S binding protein [Chitinophagaceae bacterium]
MSKVISKFRWGVQLTILSVVTITSILHQIIGGGFKGVPTTHALCPFGAIESFYNLVIGKNYISKTYYSNLVLLLGSLLLVFFAGRFFCGWICALGTIQDIPSFFGKKKLKVHPKVDYYLRFFKYIVLVGIVYFTWKTGKLVISPYDPFVAYSHLGAGMKSLWSEYSWGFSILLLMIISSFFYERLFCKYLCPLGAIYSIVGKISFFKIKRNNESCINCNKCKKICPAGIDVSNKKEVKPIECYSCMKCVDVCPTKQNSLEINVFQSVKPIKICIIAISLFITTIAITKAIGLFQTMPNSMSSVLKNNPNNIRGWMTYGEVIKEFKLNENLVYEKLGFTKQELPLDTAIKKSEEIYTKKGIEFSDEKIKNIVKDILNENR